ncbi:MAG: hypothetical protein ACOCWM_01495 [Cyclobacteriaceae bacterium]
MSKTVTLNPKQKIYVLDTQRIKTVEDIVNVLRGMKISVTLENYEKIPKESQAYFKLVDLEEQKSKFF